MVATFVLSVALGCVTAVVAVFIVPFKSPKNVVNVAVVPVTVPAKVALAPVKVKARVLLLGLNLIAPVPMLPKSAKPFVEKFKSSFGGKKKYYVI